MSIFFIPTFFFLILWIGEKFLPTIPLKQHYHRWDWLLNLVGFLMQGAVIPLCAYFLATHLLPQWYPNGEGILPCTWFQAFLLNFIGVDFLYYWQHRAMHHYTFAFAWHRSHHASPRVDIWATARNSIATNFFFVYLLINPILGYLCENHEGFFAGAMLTASLDIFRHSCIDFTRIPGINYLHPLLRQIFVMPIDHHRHHDAIAKPANYGANLILWDKIFHTYCLKKHSNQYNDSRILSPLIQLFYPLNKIINH